MATIIGVFATDTQLEQALNQLNQAGFQDDLRVIDPARTAAPNISDETLIGGIGAVNSSVNAGNTAPIPYVAPGFMDADEARSGLDLTGPLNDLNLSADEADYYAEQLRRGGKLIIVETEDEHRDFVWDIMRRSHAQQWTGKDTR
ncbi:MAG: general stress protein [Chloroflexi bacterium]|nr:general stress protein [Chloroflexota bacterium]